MLQQIMILSLLYAIGVLFAALFYPKLSLNLIFSSGLFWGGLINTIAGIILGFFGLFSQGIWILLVSTAVLLAYLNVRRRKIWRSAGWLSIARPFTVMIVLFFFMYMIIGRENGVLTSSASYPYFILGSRFYNYSTLKIAGAGFDFRIQYGMSEAMIHALGNFIGLPVMSLWHPFLWISQYAFFFAIILESADEIGLGKRIAAGIALLAAVWTGTSAMNWLHSFYIHVHLFSSFALMICVYCFWRLTRASVEQPGLAWLCSLALCGYGFCRVESPMFILIVLALFYVSHRFRPSEYRGIFYPPMIATVLWLTFILLAYRGVDTQYWVDKRLVIAIGTYILVLAFLVLNDVCKFNLDFNWIGKYLGFIALFMLSILCVRDCQRLFQTIKSVSRNMFGPLKEPGFGSWGFYWIEVSILCFFMLAGSQPNESRRSAKPSFMIFIEVIIAYLILIIILGFFRLDPYTGIRWGDSASRMLSHISPLIGLTFGLLITSKLKSLAGKKLVDTKRT